MDWYRNLWIVLSVEDKLPYLKQRILVMPVPPAGQVLPPDVLSTHPAWVKASKKIDGLMLMTMDPYIQKNLEQLGAYDMLKELKTLYAQQAEHELLRTVREFHACKQEEGQSVSSYVLKMKSYIDNLERLGHAMTQNLTAEHELLRTVREFHACKQEEGQSVSSYVLKIKSYIDNLEGLGHAMTQNLTVSLILVSPRKEYDSFVQNHNMHCMGKTMTELHAMLKLHEQTLPPKDDAPALHAIRAAPPIAPKPKNPPTPKKDNPANDAIFHQCDEVGHCTSWVYDTGCGTHICITTQGLRGSRKLKPGALSLCVGDGHRATIKAIGEFHLCLLSGLVFILHNFHYAPSITRGIISVSRLYKDGFVNRCENDNTILVSRNNLVYFSAIPQDDIYEIDLSSSNTNDSSMYAISNKRAKLNLDSTILWHYRLGHISKKCIEKLQHDGLLDSTDIKFFEKCVPCMSEKMARKPYSHQVKRAKDILGLIHTDVCGPFRTVSRQGASYFVTFTDDFSQNQLEKTIKSLRSDRGGEYMSQEFLDHLKEHGIIAHQTPPYTPQHNGVSERRNRTLLDMALVKRDTLTKLDKLEPKSIKCIFVGYPKETMGYSFYYPPENKVFVAMNAEFFENSLITQEASGRP
nr:hypothetical protein [Tanacetum cinerariifolium]